MNRSRHQSGLSLVELMVAMLLGLVLMAGVIEVFLSSRASYSLVGALSETQEEGRFATHFLTQSIRMAGYTGCNGGSPASIVNTLNNANDFLYNFNVGIQGYDDQGTATPPSDLSTTTHVLVPGTDIIAVRTIQSTGVPIADTMPKSSAELKVNNVGSSGLKDGDIVMLTDCSAAAVFQVTAVQTSANHVQHNTGSSSPGNSSKDLGQNFRIGSEVQKIATEAYFIASRDVTNKNCNSGQCGLWRKVGTDDAEELVEGVTNMQILYGVDTDNDNAPNRYVTAATLNSNNNWDSVVSVKIALLARSQDKAAPIPATAPSYELLNRQIAPPNDGRVRKVFTETIAIRNRVL